MHPRKSEDFWNFSKNKNVAKSHFRVFAYVYEVFCCSGRSKSQSCVLSTLEHLGAPKSPKSDFFIRVRRFRVVWEPQTHFRRPWAVQSCSDRHEGEMGWRTDGRRTRIPGRAPLRTAPGATHSPARRSRGQWPIHIPCAGLQAFPPHSNMYAPYQTFSYISGCTFFII